MRRIRPHRTIKQQPDPHRRRQHRLRNFKEQRQPLRREIANLNLNRRLPPRRRGEDLALHEDEEDDPRRHQRVAKVGDEVILRVGVEELDEGEETEEEQDGRRDEGLEDVDCAEEGCAEVWGVWGWCRVWC